MCRGLVRQLTEASRCRTQEALTPVFRYGRGGRGQDVQATTGETRALI